MTARLAHTERGEGPPVLMLHGYPESSYMWRHVIDAVAGAGYRAIAPDLAGYGDSEPDPPATWERHVESVELFRTTLGLDDLVLMVHDWGGLIGLRWACEHPGVARAMVISGTGFFPDGRWHGLAEVLRTPADGERLLAGLDRDGLAEMLGQVSTGIGPNSADEYWKGFADDVRRRGHLEMYRSGDFDKLAPYEGLLAGLAAPTLLLWGAEDRFAPVAGAHRFSSELPDTRTEVIEGAGHFVFEDAPRQCANAITQFLKRL